MLNSDICFTYHRVLKHSACGVYPILDPNIKYFYNKINLTRKKNKGEKLFVLTFSSFPNQNHFINQAN